MKNLLTSIRVLVVFSILTGILYPVVITVFAKAVFPAQANGSLIVSGGTVIGSSLIGQQFTDPKYFHGRPSAGSYDASSSGGSNFALTNQKLLDQVQARVEQVRQENNLSETATVPADLVFASASGLDPHISVDAAMIQVARVAKARRLTSAQVTQLVQQHTQPPFLGIFGDPVVNVLELNIALDSAVK